MNQLERDREQELAARRYDAIVKALGVIASALGQISANIDGLRQAVVKLQGR